MGTNYRSLGNITMSANIAIAKTGDEPWKVSEQTGVKLSCLVHTSHDRWLPVLWPEIEAIAQKHNWYTSPTKVGVLGAEPYHYANVANSLAGLEAVQREVNAMVERYAQMIHESSVMEKIVAAEVK